VAEQSLYRRHRPQSFDQVVGQEHIVRTLSNAIERDRVHHAYLFVGSRGTGKTSMAKILARSLNCVQGPTLTPCGECEPCRTIAAGTSLDVIEMDAASNRSVDDIRDLRERVGYAPAAGRWKVYILDEAHMLTREAWNAFLKTLEEPPPNTAFVLATTEAHKVMPTIVDRCQRFDFARPSPEDIALVLSRVATAEGITIEPAALGAIARAAGGSFRDGLGTLDQLVAYSGNEIATEDVVAILGLSDSDLLFEVTEALAAGDGAAVLECVAGLARSGRDPARLAVDLVDHLRQLLVIGTVGEVPEHFFVSEAQAERLSKQAGRLGEVALLRAIDELSAASAAIREGDDPRMTVELALLRCARPEIDPTHAALAQRLERVERSLRGEAAPGAPPEPGSAPAPETPPVEAPTSASKPEPGDGPAAAASEAVQAIAQGAVATVEQVQTEVGARAGASAQAVGEALDLERLLGLWPAVVDQVKQSGSEFLSAAFQAARPLSVDPERSTVEIGFPPSASFNKRKAEAKENRERFSEALRTVVGARLNATYVILEEEPSERASGRPASEQRTDEGELVERFKAEFDAEELIEHPDQTTQPTDAEEGES
jgi:DNA polymerase-3 subunit gamma/tau